MPANIPDTSAIHNLGKQFDTPKNVFDVAQKHYNKKTKALITQHNKQVKTTASNREKFATSAAQGIKQGRTRFAQGVKQQQTQARQAQRAQTTGVKSGRVAPAPGAPPRTFAMGTTPQQKTQAKTMQQQRNFAHGEALKFQQAQFKTQQSQRNYAHGQAIQHQKQMDKQAPKGGPVATSSVNTVTRAPSLTPAFSSAPAVHTPVKAQKIAPTTFSSQFTPQKPLAQPQGTPTASFSSGSGIGTAKPSTAPSKPPVSSQFSSAPTSSGSAFPQHVPPAGSSTELLPKLTAAQPKPNEFTVGSRNVKPMGIAARGSQLEAWAIGKQREVMEARKNKGV